MAHFEYTAAQKAAFSLISGSAKHIMLFGGSRSGKTFALCCALAVRALKAPGSRHAVIRRHFNGVKTSIGIDGGLPRRYRPAHPTDRKYNGGLLMAQKKKIARRSPKEIQRKIRPEDQAIHVLMPYRTVACSSLMPENSMGIL